MRALEGFIEPVDVIVLFANLLDNAMEVCRQCETKKEIHVSILYRQENGKLYSDVLLNR